MKLFIYDEFFDAFAQLPKKIQKKTREFLKKFRKDPTSSAINYEKISTFKDQQLRTVRIDQTYRAIVHQPKEGDQYHLLWVDHHDNAMDWAKNKVFSWNNLTQTYQVYETEEKDAPMENVTVEVPTITGPLVDISKDQLCQIGVPEVLLPSVLKIKDLDDLDAMTNYLPKDTFEHLFYLLDGVDIRTIISEVEEGLKKTDSFEEASLSPNNQRSFYFVEDDEALEMALSGELSKWRLYLHPSQHLIAFSNNKGPVKVTGGAGTGKTVAALHRLKYLAGLLPPKSKPIFFTTYTKRLIKNLAEQIASFKIPQNQYVVQNIHAYAVELAQSYNLIEKDATIIDFLPEEKRLSLWEQVLDLNLSKFSASFLNDEYFEVITLNNIKTEKDYLRISRIGRTEKMGRKDRKKVWKLVEQYLELKEKERKYSLDELINLLSEYLQEHPEKKPFSHVICDEIQDFSNVELRLLRLLAPEGPNDLFLVGDPLQKIYDKRINFKKSGINIAGRRSKKLRVNYRTTEEIKRFAVSTIKDVDYDDFEGEAEDKKGYVSLMHGDKPIYQMLSNENEEIKYILDLIHELTEVSEEQKQAYHFSDICIAGRTKNIIKGVKTMLHKEELPYYELYLDSQKTGHSNGIRLSTLHTLKGLEFKVVILVGINDHNIPLMPYDAQNWTSVEKKYHIKREKALMYVAMTRAIHKLYLVGSGKACGWF